MNRASQDRPRTSHWLTVARCELVRLLRDRKALLLAVVLPALLYPLLFFFSKQLQSLGERTLEAREVSVAVDLSDLSTAGELETQVRDALAELPRLEVSDWDAGDVRADLAEIAERAEKLETSASEETATPVADAAPFEPTWDADLLLLARTNGTSTPPTLELVYDGSNESTLEAVSRVRGALSTLRSAGESSALIELLGSDPALELQPTTLDRADKSDAAGASLGRFLPLIAVMVLISGGAFAALDAFAAEREVGTLETLLVQPVPASELARGKFAAVLLVSVVAWLGNSASLLGCALFGLLPMGAGAGGIDGELMGRLVLGSLIFLPSAILLAVALCLISSRARSFREGQNYLLPLTLLAGVLVAPSASSEVELDNVLAAAPLLGPALGMRDALAGTLPWIPALIAVLSSLFFAAALASQLARTLDAERLLGTPDVAAEAGARKQSSGLSLRTAVAVVFAVYLIGAPLQAWRLDLGLFLTLAGLVMLPAIWLGSRLARTNASTLRAELALGSLPALGVVGAVLMAPGLALGAARLVELQRRFLPMPELDAGATEAMFLGLFERSPWVVLFFIAVLPGICEELFFRGAMLSGLRRDLPRWRSIVLQAALFALVHLSVHRLAATFILGALLGAVRLRWRSLWPCIALHAAYNAAVTSGPGGAILGERVASALEHPGAWVAFAIGAVILLSGRRTSSSAQPA